jgi:hypothetical protein
MVETVKKRVSVTDDPKMTKHGPRKRPVPHPSVLARRRAQGKESYEKQREQKAAWYAANPGGTSRAGIPDGMRRADAEKVWDEAKAFAKETIQTMVEKNILTDDDKANEALETALTVMRGPVQQREKLAAARLVLEYTKAKPAQKQDISISKAEDWLALVTADASKDQQ